MPIEPGHVYFAPPDYHLLVEPAGQAFAIALSADDPVRWSRPAIDPLFESAADGLGRRLLAILLTGASDDGSDGMLAVRQRHGIAWIQDPDTALAPTMPASAIARAGADAILSLETMCRELSRLP